MYTFKGNQIITFYRSNRTDDIFHQLSSLDEVYSIKLLQKQDSYEQKEVKLLDEHSAGVISCTILLQGSNAMSKNRRQNFPFLED